jgi:maltose-binding protein MalE
MIIVKSAGGYFDLYVIAYDKAGNYAKDGIAHPTTTNGIEPGIYMFQSLTFPNNYTGKIGNFFINAVFNYY